MAKRLSEIQKEEIIKFFTEGKTIDELSIKFSCTKLTISRNLKKNLGEKKYKEYIINNRTQFISFNNDKKNASFGNEKNLESTNQTAKNTSSKDLNNNINEELSPLSHFMEIAPVDYEIENTPQKDLSSVPISEISFPKIVFMIVDKKIELETKYLKDYPEWQFLSKEELERKTIQIYFDLKIAKKFCNNDQKVIKVPNTEVFKIVAPLLLSRGISRIVSDDKLIAL